MDLAKACVRELLERTEIDPALVGAVVMGQVIPSVKAPNLAREVVLGTVLPRSVPAHTVNRACASANEAIASVASSILTGQLDVGIAGGAESLSDVPILFGKKMARAFVEASRAKDLGGKLKAFSKIRPGTWPPTRPRSPSPRPASRWGSRRRRWPRRTTSAARSRTGSPSAPTRTAPPPPRTAAFPRRCARCTCPPRYEVSVKADNLLRKDTSLDALAALPPVFDRKYGTVTAGNSSPLTDGAAAVLLMSETRAKAQGYAPLAYVRSWAVSAVDPGGQLLMGPALAIPKALERAGLDLSDIDLIDMHEAFAAQVASNIQALESEAWAREQLGRTRAVGKVDRERLNVCGGSIALGHPFGATGARITTTLANELKRRKGKFGLLSVCAQGGMGFAMVLER